MKSLKVLLTALLFSTFVGAQVDDFTLPSATDTSNFTLSKNKGKFVVLHFLLKTECPYCIRHTNEHIDAAKGLTDVVQIFIKPDKDSQIKQWALQVPKSERFPIYKDENAKLAEKFKIPGGYKFHGQTVHYPALIIIDKEGKEVFRYVGKDNSDRYSAYQLAKKIKKLSKMK